MDVQFVSLSWTPFGPDWLKVCAEKSGQKPHLQALANDVAGLGGGHDADVDHSFRSFS